MICFHIHRLLIVRTPHAYLNRCLALAICGLLIPSACWAVDINAGFNTAADQPKLNASLSRNGTTPLISPDGFDPNNPLQPVDTINFQPYLDTGTSGILLSKETAASFGIQNLKVGGTDVVFSDVAVGGTFNTNVSESIYVRIARFNETVDTEDTNQYTQTSGPLNAQVALAANPFGAADIVGMPALVGKVLVIDSGDLNNAFAQAQAGDPSLLFGEVSLRTYIYNPGQAFVGGTSNPGIPTSNLHVKLSSADFSRFTTITPSGAQGPAQASNPFIGPNPLLAFDGQPSDGIPKVKISYSGATAEGSFLLDTGAQFSMISNAMAAQLHITRSGSDLVYTDPLNPGSPQIIADQFTLPISGADGNLINASGFYLDSLLLRTLERTTDDETDPNNMNFLHVPVLVNDITSHDASGALDHQDLTLDGVFGMNLLTSTYDGNSLIDLIFGNVDPADVTAPGAFSFITFDQVNGTLGFTLTASVPEPSSVVLAGFGILLGAAVLRTRKKSPRE